MDWARFGDGALIEDRALEQVAEWLRAHAEHHRTASADFEGFSPVSNVLFQLAEEAEAP